MPDAENLLEELLEKQLELVRARKGSAREQALEDRIAALETQLARKPKAEVEEAAEELELDDDELEAVKAFIKERRETKSVTPPADPPADPPEEKKRTRAGRKAGQLYKWDVDDDGNIRELDIPTVYSGEDEPEQVELPDEDAA